MNDIMIKAAVAAVKAGRKVVFVATEMSEGDVRCRLKRKKK